MTRPSNPQVAWATILARMGIDPESQLNRVREFSARQIKTWTSGGEARLLTKFDSRASRPELLRKIGATIFPVRNGHYALVPVDGYHSAPGLSESSQPIVLSSHGLVTLPVGPRSESQVLDSAAASGMLSRFFGERTLALTIRGRLRSGSWTFSVGAGAGHSLSVAGVQIEVDAGFEADRIYVVEAKMGLVDDFIVRQLYYPTREWTEKNLGKQVIPIFVYYHDRRFVVSRYRFQDIGRYDSILLEESQVFALEETKRRTSFRKLVLRSSMGHEPEVPFPQADDLRRVIDLVDIASRGVLLKQELATRYQFDPRQSDYYVNAARYLGLVHLDASGLVLCTELGEKFSESERLGRFEILVGQLAKCPVFRDCFVSLVRVGEEPSREWVTNRVARWRKEIRSDSTRERRAQTVLSWLTWIAHARSQLEIVE